LQSLKKSSRITYIKKDIDDIIINKNKSQNDLQLIPRDYQLEAYNALNKKHRTILQLPCGMGKTLISIMLAKDYKKIIVLSNLKAHCEQNKNRFEEQMINYTTLLVESGNNGTRDINKIKKLSNTIENFALFSTYKSLDIIMELLKDINDDTKILEYLIIIDEFHNISYNDIYDNIVSPMYKLLHSKFKIMFMSATPRIFNIINKSNNIDNTENTENTQDTEE
jgi:superfamily II DNA or RNA helicase